MTWADGRLVAFDTETTDVDLETARIVTATIHLVGGGEEPVTHNWLIAPDVPISEGATAVHGITNEHAQTNGQPASHAISGILDLLEAHDGLPVVAYNARFDFTLLDREAQRNELGPLAARTPRLRVVDPLVIDRHLDKFRKGSRRLADVCEHYGIKLEDAHDAGADALAAARLAWVLAKRGKVVRKVRKDKDGNVIIADAIEKKNCERQWEHVREDLDALHFVQEVWFAEQAKSRADYKAKKGEPHELETGWPVSPVKETV